MYKIYFVINLCYFVINLCYFVINLCIIINMGLIKAVIVLVIGFFFLTTIETNKKHLKKIPIIGNELYKKVEKNKEVFFIVLIALLHMLI